MKLLMFSMSSVMSITFTQMNHPLAMWLILLMQTVLISVITGMLSQSFWFSYILFLIFLGGMLVLFIYVTSLASNEMFSMSSNLILLMLMILPILIILFYMLIMKFNNQETMNLFINSNHTFMPIMKLYNLPTNIITIMLASYLFLTLIAVVKITSIFKGPLRQMN
uniref:NADH-ubiquinone oxidoreductase chain 6 n=1 Tax=Epilampra maya TaxID=2093436 RepID=A0A2P1H8P9_9NEOP|nr:NADH dehydrogenase subunit 6 [Epilampra maya]